MASNLSKMKHIVVLMLENRSFDHLLGYLKANGIKPAVDGLTGTETNPTNPSAGTSPVMVSPSAADGEPSPDAGHELKDVSEQYYGHVDLTFPSGGPMNGFVANYANQPANGPDIMKCVDPAKIPALVELAKRFCVCDQWHASVPGSTWPNRMYAHAATSVGAVTNSSILLIQKTIFDLLKGAKPKLDWRVYYHDAPVCSLLFFSLAIEWALGPYKGRFRRFKDWATDLNPTTCALPSYTWIEPRYFSYKDPFTKKTIEANDQHPSHSLAAGDELIRTVYEPLRASKCWPHTMLVIVHDEHGGTYDHRFPATLSVNPDGINSGPPDPVFDFTRYGARVPAVIVSAWAGDGVCNTLYDHTSVLKTLEQRFGLPWLTMRDQAANALDACLSATSARLTDMEAPLKLPPPAVLAMKHVKPVAPRRRPLSALQRGILAAISQIHVPGEDRSKVQDVEDIHNEQDAGEFVDKRVRALARAAARRGSPARRPRVKRAARRPRRRGR